MYRYKCAQAGLRIKTVHQLLIDLVTPRSVRDCTTESSIASTDHHNHIRPMISRSCRWQAPPTCHKPHFRPHSSGNHLNHSQYLSLTCFSGKDKTMRYSKQASSDNQVKRLKIHNFNVWKFPNVERNNFLKRNSAQKTKKNLWFWTLTKINKNWTRKYVTSSGILY